jgi:hypothetical protein
MPTRFIIDLEIHGDRRFMVTGDLWGQEICRIERFGGVTYPAERAR